ncbi:MAG: helix-turn-helix domain-containing protein [Thermoanaerobaculia bacterium]
MRKLAQAGYSQQDIAETLGVSARTLRRNFVLPLKEGTKACSNLLRAELVDIALKGNVQALIFANKAIGGLREDGPTAEERDREPQSRGIIIRAHCETCGRDPSQGAIIVVGEDGEELGTVPPWPRRGDPDRDPSAN